MTWASNDTSIATVENGAVKVVTQGTCDISYTSADGSNISAVCHITVNEPEQK